MSSLTHNVLPIKNFLIIEDNEKKNIVEEILKLKKNHDEKPNSPKAHSNFLVLSENIFFIDIPKSVGPF